MPIPVEQRPPSGSPGLASQEASGAGRGASAAGEGRRQGVLEAGGPPDAEEGKMAAWRSRAAGVPPASGGARGFPRPESLALSTDLTALSSQAAGTRDAGRTYVGYFGGIL